MSSRPLGAVPDGVEVKRGGLKQAGEEAAALLRRAWPKASWRESKLQFLGA